MGLLADVGMFTLSYTLVLLIGFFVINFLSNGFFWTFIRVKASRGKKPLVMVHGILDKYYKIGEFEGNILKWKDKEKNKRSLQVQKNDVYRSIGVNCVEVDDEKNAVITKDFDAVPGFDAVKFDNLLVRALYKPSIDVPQKIEKVLIIIIIGALAFVAWKVMTIESMVNALGNV